MEINEVVSLAIELLEEKIDNLHYIMSENERPIDWEYKEQKQELVNLLTQLREFKW